MLSAGRMDRRVRIERPLLADDGFQVVESGWEEIAEVWAERENLSDGERARSSGSTLATATHRFRIRWSVDVKDVDPKHRLISEGETFAILGVKEMGRREGLEITAVSRADD